jgi:hypothetical protein
LIRKIWKDTRRFFPKLVFHIAPLMGEERGDSSYSEAGERNEKGTRNA